MKDLKQIIKALDLNLNGLTVLTEAASQEYQLMPLLAALAGANVVALGKNTAYGDFKVIKKEIEDKATRVGIKDQLKIYHLDDFDDWASADIITNSGMLRPLSKDRIAKLKPTAVIPLLWETWEFRPSEIDLLSCQNNRIPVIGTDENFPAIDMYMYPGMLAIYLLNMVKVDYSFDEIALFGGGLTGTLIAKHLNKLNSSVLWFCDAYREDLTELVPFNYTQTSKLFEKKNLKVIFISEHSNPIKILGNDGLLNVNDLVKKYPNVKIIHLCGNIDLDHINQSNVKIIPDKVAEFGYMSILPNVFGNTPMLKLFGGGLKVGEIAARARIKGETLEQTIKRTVDFGIGQDFYGGFLNFKL